jgi:hypothetical protein
MKRRHLVCKLLLLNLLNIAQGGKDKESPEFESFPIFIVAELSHFVPCQ